MLEPLPTVGEHDNRSGDDYYDDGTYDEVGELGFQQLPPRRGGGSGSLMMPPMSMSPSEANPLRRRVESCLLQRERTVDQLLSWLRTAYVVQQNVGAKYVGEQNIGRIPSLKPSASLGALRRSASGLSGASSGGEYGAGTVASSSSSSDLRNWRTISSSTRDDHRIKTAVLLAALRMHTCELVEALDEWRRSRPPLQVVAASGLEVTLPRPFVWRGRWWPLQLCLRGCLRCCRCRSPPTRSFCAGSTTTPHCGPEALRYQRTPPREAVEVAVVDARPKTRRPPLSLSSGRARGTRLACWLAWKPPMLWCARNLICSSSNLPSSSASGTRRRARSAGLWGEEGAAG